MGTNKIKPFATSGSANVMTDEELGSAEELSTGFKLRSKADSRLIGKLIQNASAAAYAVGKFTADNSDGTITGTDAEGFATNFDTAIKKVITETAGEVGDYVTSEQLTSAVEPKADKTELAKYAQLSGAAFTGTVTVNGQNVATADQLAELEVDLSNYTGNVSFTDGAGSFKMSASGITIQDPAIAGGVATPLSSFALKSEIPTDVLTKTEASSTYLTQATASSTYATQTTVTEGLAGKANTVHTHTIENVTGLQDALDGKQATGDYAVKSDLDDYLPLAGGTIDGDLTVTGTINASIEGTTENAVKLATARNITLTGAVTGASTTGFDGSADVAINTTAVNGTMVTGVVPEATKATQDGDGNVISTTYAKVSQLTSVMTYKGTVASESALPKSDQSIGDVYNVTDTNMNYAWDGSKWDQLGSTVDLSGYLKTENANSTFATKSELTSGYLPLAGGTLTGNVTVPAPTAQGHASTKKYVDDKITGLNISQYATTTSLAKYAPLASPAFTGTATLRGQNIATVNQIPDVSDFATKSEVSSKYLPLAGGTVTGTVVATGFTGPLTGTASQATADGAGNPIVDTYATKSALSSGLAGKSNTNHTHTAAQVTDLSTTLAKYLPLSGGTLTGKVTGTITQADAATKATNDGSGKNIAATYATKTEVSAKADSSALAKYLPVAGGTVTGALTVSGGITGSLNGNATTATTATSANHATTADSAIDATKIALTGNRGQLAGWETVATGTTTIDQNSPDSMESNRAITVRNGTSGTCWTKVAHLTSASPSVSLETNWRWQGGSTPELKQDGFLVLCWCGSRGLAIYNNVS